MNKYQFDKILKKLQKNAPKNFDVLKMFLTGLSDTEIAKERGKTRGTVRKQISQLYEKFEISSSVGTKKEQLIELFSKHKPELVKLATPKFNTPLKGVVPPEDPRYLERDADEKVKTIFDNHKDESSLFIRVRGSKGMGKSSLLTQLRQFLEYKGHTVGLVNLELTIFKQKALDDLDTLLYDFTQAIKKAFKDSLGESTPPDLKEHWEDDIAPGISCTEYLHNYIFKQLPKPKTLLIDGIDLVLGQKTQIGFCDVIRSWNEEKMKKITSDEIVWPNLIIAYSTVPYALYNMQNSPFNVGYEIDLEEFNEAQIVEQAQKYDLDLEDLEIEKLIKLIGGHPELINLTLHLVAQKNLDFDILLKNADQRGSPFSDYLRQNLKLLEDRPKLKDCFQKILKGQHCKDEFSIFQLEKAGLVKKDETSGKECASCQLYEKYFTELLLTNEEV